MSKGLYRKLAIQNIKKNRSTFMPFAIASIAMIAMFYMLYAIQDQVNESIFPGAATMRIILRLGVIVCGLFTFFVHIYTNGFLIKRRTTELGLYSILGMEKRHISRVVFWEMLLIGVISVIGGIFSGIVLSKFMFMIFLKILNLDTGLDFKISPGAMIVTTVVFSAIYIVIMIKNLIKIYRLKPIELMRNEHAGEREPKAKWLLALAGIVLIGIGYYLALTIETPISALNTFFVAVLCVIAGTYLLFLSVSIAILKILKKNKGFYYHKKHFITVSGMMYRMKQNAVGLANICILSTCVLVVLSTTVSLYVGMEDILRTRFPRDVSTTYFYDVSDDDEEYLEQHHYDYSVLEPLFEKRAEKYNVKIKDVDTNYSFVSAGTYKDNKYEPTVFEDVSTLTALETQTLQDYQERTGDTATLLENEVIVYTSNKKQLTSDTINLSGKEYQIKKVIDELKQDESAVYERLYVVVADMERLKEVRDAVRQATSPEENMLKDITFEYAFDLEGAFEDKEAFCLDLRKAINKTGIAHLNYVENVFTSRLDFFGLYGAILFIGIFIGTMFVIATVMIIYYKQISEGYDDRHRFEIMKKVGMSEQEAKGVIRNQILMVFFLPIILAVIHICFAFNIIKKMFVMFNFSNVGLYILCTVATVIIFFIAYGLVYNLTAKTYYKITNSAAVD